MKRTTSLRNAPGRRQSRETAVAYGVLAFLGLMGLLALTKVPHGPANSPDPHADLSNAHTSHHDQRQLIQKGNEGGMMNLRTSSLMNDSAKRLAANLSKSNIMQLDMASPGKKQSTDQVGRLDRSAARNQLRTKTKAVAKLGVATEYPLVIYTLLNSDDPENEANLRYYVREGIREDDGSSHIIIVHPKKDMRTLPSLQVENARYVRAKERDCLFGAMGRFLKSSEIDISKFTSFIFLTSAVRGPFLPAHVKGLGIYWQQLLAAKLGNNTKLVGPLISCQDIVWPESVAEEDRRHSQPHFPPHMMATDKAGLDLLMKSGDVFQCHGRDAPNPDHFSAMMASTVILQNGYNLDCLMQRYQGVRWTEKETWGCNAGLKANEGDHYYDGISVHPMEVMFVEVTGMMLRKGLSMAKTAKKYDKWKQAQAELKEAVTFNMYAFDPAIFRGPRISYMEKRGPGCFDFNFYLQNNPEPPVDASNLALVWTHFVESGQFEDRQYRFNCLDILSRSFNCFDSNYYNRANEDLNQLRLEGRPLTPQEAWNHFLEVGYFESRKYRFMDICQDDLDSPNNLGEGS